LSIDNQAIVAFQSGRESERKLVAICPSIAGGGRRGGRAGGGGRH